MASLLSAEITLTNQQSARTDPGFLDESGAREIIGNRGHGLQSQKTQHRRLLSAACDVWHYRILTRDLDFGPVGLTRVTGSLFGSMNSDYLGDAVQNPYSTAL
jgi:hypothetical protein